jgi:acyl carrier protein
MEKSEMFETLKAFIIKETYEENIEITPNTIIETELGVTGDDAVNFIIAFGKKFNVDVSNFMAADYFEGEGFDLIGSLIRAITGKKKPKKKVLTVGDLDRAVKAGKLDESVIENKDYLLK